MANINDSSDHNAGKVDFAAAERFLALLDPGPNPLWSFQMFDDGREEPKRAALTKVLHAARDQLPSVLPKLQLFNAGGPASL